MKKRSHHVARHQLAAPKENESASRTRKAVVDARDQLLSSAPAEAPQPTTPAREVTMVDAAPVSAVGSTAPVPPAPVITKPMTDQRVTDQPVTDQHMAEQPIPPQVDVEKLLADSPAATDAAAASVRPAAAPIADVTGSGAWMTNWLGMLLLALGFASLLSSIRLLRGGRAGRDIAPSEDEADDHRSLPTPEPSFDFDLMTFNQPAMKQKLFRPLSARPAI